MWHCQHAAKVDAFCLTGSAFPADRFSDRLIKVSGVGCQWEAKSEGLSFTGGLGGYVMGTLAHNVHFLTV